MKLPHDATVSTQQEQQGRTEATSDASARRLGRQLRDAADLMCAAACRGDAEQAIRYWREVGDYLIRSAR